MRKRKEKEKVGEAEKRQKILKLSGNFVIDRQGKNENWMRKKEGGRCNDDEKKMARGWNENQMRSLE